MFHFYSIVVCACAVCVLKNVVLENVSRLVLKSSSPLFIPNSPASLAYISFINPVSCALLWSLCLRWAMVIISLLCSHRFMRLACLLPSSLVFFSLDILTLPLYCGSAFMPSVFPSPISVHIILLLFSPSSTYALCASACLISPLTQAVIVTQHSCIKSSRLVCQLFMRNKWLYMDNSEGFPAWWDKRRKRFFYSVIYLNLFTFLWTAFEILAFIHKIRFSFFFTEMSSFKNIQFPSLY